MDAVSYFNTNFRVSGMTLNDSFIEAVKGKVQGKVAQDVIGMLNNTNNVKVQFKVAATIYCWAVQESGIPGIGGVSSMLMDQARKIGKYGDKSYPLSENQITALIRSISGFVEDMARR